MEDLLLYLIPGIVGYEFFTLFFSNTPEENSLSKMVQHFTTITVLSAMLITIIVPCFSSTINFGSDISVITWSNVETLKIWQVLLMIFLVMFIPSLVWGGFLVLIVKIVDKGCVGSNVYTEGVNDLSKVVVSIEGKDIEKNRPVIIKHLNRDVAKGQMIYKYGKPWNFKEVLVDEVLNPENFDGSESRELTYYDFENQIEIIVYDHYLEREKEGEENAGKQKE